MEQTFVVACWMLESTHVRTQANVCKRFELEFLIQRDALEHEVWSKLERRLPRVDINILFYDFHYYEILIVLNVFLKC